MAEKGIDTETHICPLWGNLSYVYYDAIVLWPLVNVWDTVGLLIVFTCAGMARISFFASFSSISHDWNIKYSNVFEYLKKKTLYMMPRQPMEYLKL